MQSHRLLCGFWINDLIDWLTDWLIDWLIEGARNFNYYKSETPSAPASIVWPKLSQKLHQVKSELPRTACVTKTKSYLRIRVSWVCSKFSVRQRLSIRVPTGCAGVAHVYGPSGNILRQGLAWGWHQRLRGTWRVWFRYQSFVNLNRAVFKGALSRRFRCMLVKTAQLFD